MIRMRSMLQWLFIAWFQFLIRYRKTMLGPLWLLVGPALFIVFLGRLYGHIGSVTAEAFIPHLTIGLVVWTLISGFVISSTMVFPAAKSQILQGGMGLTGIIFVHVFSIILQFAHQIVLIVIVMVIFKVSLSWYALISLVGLALLIANGIWLSVVFGIIGARYRDLFEVMQAIMRIAFLATPIIWTADSGGRGSIMGPYLIFNPFYHYLELVRAPLLGKPIAPLSWAVVLSITAIGIVLAWLFKKHFARHVALWV